MSEDKKCKSVELNIDHWPRSWHERMDRVCRTAKPEEQLKLVDDIHKIADLMERGKPQEAADMYKDVFMESPFPILTTVLAIWAEAVSAMMEIHRREQEEEATALKLFSAMTPRMSDLPKTEIN